MPLARYSGRSTSWVRTVLCRIPRRAATSAACSISPGGNDGDTAVTASARSPNDRAATAATRAESVPPEYATTTPPVSARTPCRRSSLVADAGMRRDSPTGNAAPGASGLTWRRDRPRSGIAHENGPGGGRVRFSLERGAPHGRSLHPSGWFDADADVHDARSVTPGQRSLLLGEAAVDDLVGRLRARARARHGRQEVLALERQQAEVRLGRHRRGPGNVPQQGDLAEVIARPQASDLAPSHRDDRPALLQHEEPIARLAFTDHARPGRGP